MYTLVFILMGMSKSPTIETFDTKPQCEQVLKILTDYYGTADDLMSSVKISKCVKLVE